MSFQQVTWPSGMTNGSLDGLIGRPFDGWWLNFRNFNYVSLHLKHFSKCEAAISELRAVFESLHVWLQVCTILFHLIKILRNYCERTWFLPVKFECYSGKDLKCFVTDCRKGHQSKTAVFQLSSQVLILYSFLYKVRPWISKFWP